ncbi:polyphenol oxidase I, chloroplastic-like [Ananas comosus]|uniref:Polyphenol oxidase I, chloroplastic-like n=2 Tax=Ananas comosus TaxID=4615 RepID=A0A6P5GAN2_ANACO|nr:polyphenol oxidase I, chloroplastic-like [Ananas comosus]
MASLRILAHPTNNNSTLSSPSFACSFSQQKLHRHLPPPCKSPKPPRRKMISCKSEKSRGIDRRDLLLGVGGLYGAAAGLGLDRRAVGAPIQAPDISTCGPPADLPATAPPTDCCPPYQSTIVDFKLPPRSDPLRVRPAAQSVDADYLAKYKKAVELMKALPADDPRNFVQQAKVHCAYCDGAYDQIGFPDLEIQVHSSWLFFPWHRFYLYFNERILGKLIGDDTFALPFWNWDAPGGMQIPAIYADASSPLYDKLRNAKHQPPTLVDLDYNGTDPTFTPEQQIAHNLTIMYRQVISGGKTPELFMGAAYRAGDAPDPGAGTLELVPHNTMHLWTGDPNQPNDEDMGTFYAAARDPIFFAHHGNVDRMWYVWRKLGGTHRDFTDPDWLNASFLFYDENAQLVRVKVKDCLSADALRYTYQDVDIPWISAKPTPKKTPGGAAPSTTEAIFPVVLDKPVSSTVARPKTGRSTGEEEVLVVEGIELDKDVAVKFDVYINAPDNEGVGPEASEFAGSFVQVPHKHKKGKKEKARIKTTLRLGITDLLEDIGAEDDESVLVTLVPRIGEGLVKVGGLRIDFSK